MKSAVRVRAGHLVDATASKLSVHHFIRVPDHFEREEMALAALSAESEKAVQIYGARCGGAALLSWTA